MGMCPAPESDERSDRGHGFAKPVFVGAWKGQRMVVCCCLG